MYLKVAKNHPNAKLPERANLSDAGTDVFYCGEEAIVLYSGESHLFDTGLSIEVPHGYALQVLNRSSIASKKGVTVGACLVDPGYVNNVYIDLHFVGSGMGSSKVEKCMINKGDKIAQLVCYPVVHWLPIEVKKEDLYKEIQVVSNRGNGGFGSTGS